jgi:hypothetical protein
LERIVVRHNDVWFNQFPPSIAAVIRRLQHSPHRDMRVDLNEAAMRHLVELVADLRYDICVLSGGFRGKTFGPFETTLDGVFRRSARALSGRPACPPSHHLSGSDKRFRPPLQIHRNKR